MDSPNTTSSNPEITDRTNSVNYICSGFSSRCVTDTPEGWKGGKKKEKRPTCCKDAVVSDTVSSCTTVYSGPTSLVVSCWLARGCIHCAVLRRTARVGAMSDACEFDMRCARRFAVSTRALRPVICARSHPHHPHARTCAAPVSCVRTARGKDEL